MKKKGFIFDLDGVIVDTAKYHYQAWKKLAATLRINFSEADNEQLKGVSRVRSLETILSWGNKQLSNSEFDTLLESKNDDYLSYIANMSREEVLADVPRVLDFLKSKNQPMALGSASKNARRILREVELFETFDTIVDGTNVEKAKPDPEVFLKAAAGLGMPPEDCIVFEDSLAGIQAANTAGMVSVGIGKKEILTEADFVFSNFTEISNQFIEKQFLL